MKAVFLFVLAGCLLAPSAGRTSDQPRGDAAFLFAYYPKQGRQEQFDAGYRRHLDWHREHRDPLPWYGWYVATGERAGMFVDGS